MGAALSAARPEPQATRRLMPNGVMGMLLFVFTEVMLFAGLISAHAIVRSGSQEWPPAGQPRLPFAETMLNTAALLASGVALVFAHVTLRRKSSQAAFPLLLSMLLGAFFVIAQGREWAALISEGLGLVGNPYGAFFYVIVGLHALHAVAAIPMLAWAWLRLRAGRLDAAQLGTVEVFWYFVVLVWPLIYLRVYL